MKKAFYEKSNLFRLSRHLHTHLVEIEQPPLNPHDLKNIFKVGFLILNSIDDLKKSKSYLGYQSLD